MNSRPSYLWPSTSAGAGQRGVVLILAVLAVVLLTTLAVAITAAVRVELLASRSALERTQALFLAEAGINRARAILLYEDVGVDSLQDPWGPDCEEPLWLPQELGAGSYQVRVIDASGRINVNRANHAILYSLTGDPDIAAAIIDWRDPNDQDAAKPDRILEARVVRKGDHPHVLKKWSPGDQKPKPKPDAKQKPAPEGQQPDPDDESAPPGPPSDPAGVAYGFY